MEALLSKVFAELKKLKKIRTQTEFANDLELTKSYISQLLQQTTPIPDKVRKKLHEKYGISQLWLASEGNRGSMFEENKRTEQAFKIALGNPSVKVQDLLSEENETLKANTNYKTSDNQQVNTKEEENINDKLVSSDFTKSNTTMTHDFQVISRSIDTQAKALDKCADAMLIMAKTQDRLTSILEKVMSGETEGMHVKQTVG